MAIEYNREYDYFGDFSEVPEMALKDPKNKRLIRLSADEPIFEWKSKDECTQDEYVLYTTGIIVDNKIKEPSELKFEVEPGKLFILGTYACCRPHIGMEMRSMKFDKNVTFYLSGPGALCIHAIEIKKRKWFWQVAKQFIDQCLWKNNDFNSSKVKVQ